MKIKIRTLTKTDAHRWDAYVRNHPDANLYHLSGWKTVIEKTYGHDSYYLMATNHHSSIVGILPLVHMRHFIFGNKLVSIPFFDMGGILSDDAEAERALLDECIRIGQSLNVDTIELRHERPCSFAGNPDFLNPKNPINSINSINPKVRMLLDLPDSSDDLMKSFKSKLRSQIKRPIKEGLKAKVGGSELIDDFYAIFCTNMRDLGSPVHSKKMIRTVMEVFEPIARIIMVHKGDSPIACGLVIGFNQILENPWASSLRSYSRMAPNMLLYWTMLAYACDNGYRSFDFGRSTPGEGTYKFKAQWGAQPHPLNWQAYHCEKKNHQQPETEKEKFGKFIQYWQQLPVPATRIIGPMIRKHIAL